MKTIKYYHDSCLKCNVLLLVDVFQKFRNNSLKNYRCLELCPSHYLSAPDLGWNAMLKMTKIKLERIPDLGMYIFFEKRTRVGISYIANRYSKANNKYLKCYDQKRESKHIIYLDANNLYGYSVSKFFRTVGFKLIDPIEFDLNKYTSNNSKEWVLENDLEYPKELQELHNGYRLAPDKIEIKREMLSEYQLRLAVLHNIISNV